MIVKTYLQIFKLSIIALLLNACTGTKPTITKEAVLFQVGNYPTTVPEFKYEYEKSNTNADSLYVRKSVEDYLDLFINFKLKIADARSQQLDSTEAFRKEFATYEEQLTQPYLTDQNVTDSLARQAYERMKEEVNASHILIKIGEESDPADTLKAYNQMLEIRKKAITGEDFGELALANSQDGSVGSNRGNLGYFTGLQMVYQFENAAYQTKVGEISPIVRSQYGYHILKINNRRPASGRVSVAHIMIQLGRKATKDESDNAQKRIDEIYQMLQKGEDWDKLCKQFSDDATSKNQSGKLPDFKTGEVLPEFEEVAFALKTPQEISKPIKTAYGWHIIKLLEKKPIPPFNEIETSIKQDIAKDARNKLSKSALVEKIKRENAFVEYPKPIQEALKRADERLLKGSWSYTSTEPLMVEKLFSLKNKQTKTQQIFTVKDFFDFVYEKQVPKPEIKDPKYYLLLYYSKFKENSILSFEKKNLPVKYNDFRLLLNQYREGMMLFQMMTDKVWEKGIQDTTGCRQYFLKNRQNYQWEKRANVVIYKVANEIAMAELKPYLSKNIYPTNAFSADKLYFEKADVSLDEESLKIIQSIADVMKKNPKLKIEVSGHADPAENKRLAEQRISAVVKYLTFKQVDMSRIITKDFGITKPVSNTDRSKNRRIEFTYFSTAKADLEALINQSNPLNLKITEGTFQKDDIEPLNKIEWKPGLQTIQEKGLTYVVEILDIKEPRLKDYDEARGFVITDYQKFLEQEWLTDLKKKFPLQINQAEVEKLIKR